MRTTLRRAAILIGGTAAGILIGLSLADTAHAGDQPTPIQNAITGIVDTLLPQPSDENQVGDLTKEIVDQVANEAATIMDTVVNTTPPPPPADEPQQPAGQALNVLADTTQDPTPATPARNPQPGRADTILRRPTPGHQPGTPEGETPHPRVHTCRGDHNPDHHQTTQPMSITDIITRAAAAASPGAITSAPTTPTPSSSAATGAGSTTNPTTTGCAYDAATAAQPEPPYTTAVPVPGRDQAADGITHQPDAPSG